MVDMEVWEVDMEWADMGDMEDIAVDMEEWEWVWVMVWEVMVSKDI